MKNKSLLTAHPPSPLQMLEDEWLAAKKIQLWIKRDDLLRVGDEHAFCGNKWRKLKYNLLEAHRQNLTSLLTFGGAYSNHLAAVAQSGQIFDFQTIGIIRGNAHESLNPTLEFCKRHGMQLHYLDRESYRHKHEPAFAEKLRKQFGKFYLLPEGGTNPLALQGCQEIVSEIEQQFSEKLPDFIAVSCGTGGTLAGIILELEGRSSALGISVLKGDFLKQEVRQLLETSKDFFENWDIQTDYHCGGYAKFTPEFTAFINQFKTRYGIPLDPVYTGKLFFGLFDLIRQGFFPYGSSIVAVHTGGLQGIAGFNERFGHVIDL